MVESTTHNGENVGSSPILLNLDFEVSGKVIGNLSGSCPDNGGSNPPPARDLIFLKRGGGG